MPTHGIIYLTRIQEKADGTAAQVTAQYRWNGSEMASPPDSELWQCNQWDNDGRCQIEHPLNLPENALDIALNPGESVVAVEIFYREVPLFHYVLKKNLLLYSRTVL